MTDRTTDLALQVEHVAVKLDRVMVGQGHIQASVIDLKAVITHQSADLADVKADIAEMRTDHGVRLERLESGQARVEAQQRQMVDVMNDNFTRLFAMLKKDGPAE